MTGEIRKIQSVACNSAVTATDGNTRKASDPEQDDAPASTVERTRSAPPGGPETGNESYIMIQRLRQQYRQCLGKHVFRCEM